MGIVKTAFKAKADTVGAEIKELLKEHGNKKIGEVTLSQVFQGMRGITGRWSRRLIGWWRRCRSAVAAAAARSRARLGWVRCRGIRCGRSRRPRRSSRATGRPSVAATRAAPRRAQHACRESRSERSDRTWKQRSWRCRPVTTSRVGACNASSTSSAVSVSGSARSTGSSHAPRPLLPRASRRSTRT